MTATGKPWRITLGDATTRAKHARNELGRAVVRVIVYKERHGDGPHPELEDLEDKVQYWIDEARKWHAIKQDLEIEAVTMRVWTRAKGGRET